MDRGDMVGVKVVLFPLLGMVTQPMSLIEFTCDASVPGEYFDVELATSDDPDFQATWPSKCASPIDRVYCIDRKFNGWGAVDDLPHQRVFVRRRLYWGSSLQGNLSHGLSFCWHVLQFVGMAAALQGPWHLQHLRRVASGSVRCDEAVLEAVQHRRNVLVRLGTRVLPASL